MSSFKHNLAPICLLAFALVAIAISGDAGDFAISVLSYLAVLSLLLDNRPQLQPLSIRSYSIIIVAIGFLMIGLSYYFFTAAISARMLPLFFLLSYWSLRSDTLASIKQQYWKPLLLLLLLALPDRSLLMALAYPFLAILGWDAMTFPTAHAATFLTNLTGLPATLTGLDINMENAIVTVWQGCDGARNMDFLLRLGLMLIIVFPIRSSRWLLTISVAVILAFSINAIRVALLAHLANSGDFTLFDYWHEGDGSKLFNLGAIILFALFGYFQISSKTDIDQSVKSKQSGQPQA